MYHTNITVSNFLEKYIGLKRVKLTDSSLWFDKINLRWFIEHTKGLQVFIFKLLCISVPEDSF